MKRDFSVDPDACDKRIARFYRVFGGCLQIFYLHKSVKSER